MIKSTHVGCGEYSDVLLQCESVRLARVRRRSAGAGAGVAESRAAVACRASRTLAACMEERRRRLGSRDPSSPSPSPSPVVFSSGVNDSAGSDSAELDDSLSGPCQTYPYPYLYICYLYTHATDSVSKLYYVTSHLAPVYRQLLSTM